ncbi:MAG: ribonuclease Z [Abditibacteriota bacterium]|nr:ribonuclease Z [Abditibacteriota bacterium]
MPAPKRALSSAVLASEGVHILFDCGEGTQTAAMRSGVSPLKIDVIALTHYHGDHIFGLPGLLQTMSAMGRTEPLRVTGPAGFRKYAAPLIKAAGITDFDILQCDVSEPVSLSALDERWPRQAFLSSFGTRHGCCSCGYVFELRRQRRLSPEAADRLGVPVTARKLLQQGSSVRINGRTVTPDDVLGGPRRGIRVVYSGDTARCRALETHSAGADLLICDATYGSNDQKDIAGERGHMTFADAAETALAAGVGKLCLTHFSQMIREPAEYLDNARGVFSSTVAGSDGMTLELRFE